MHSKCRIAAILLLLQSISAPSTASGENPDNEPHKALIIKDLNECGHGEYVMFTVLWKGVVGIATEHFLFSWNKPGVGDQLSGPFLETGTMEASYLNKPDTTRLDILKTGIPIANQGALVKEYCMGVH